MAHTWHDIAFYEGRGGLFWSETRDDRRDVNVGGNVEAGRVVGLPHIASL